MCYNTITPGGDAREETKARPEAATTEQASVTIPHQGAVTIYIVHLTAPKINKGARKHEVQNDKKRNQKLRIICL